MDRPDTKSRYKPSKYCSECKREVYETVHTSDSYWSDWFTKEGKIFCIDCYRR